MHRYFPFLVQSYLPKSVHICFLVTKIDDNGDSTLYYTESGKIIWVSHEVGDNYVVVIPNKNFLTFKYWALYGDKDNLTDNDAWNKVLRTLGEAYNITMIKRWYNTLEKGEWAKSKLFNINIRKEKKSFLINSDITSETKVGQERFFDVNISIPRRFISAIHTHYIHSFVEIRPSLEDHHVESPYYWDDHLRDIEINGFGGMWGGKSKIFNIFIYNSKVDQNIIIDNNSFKDNSINNEFEHFVMPSSKP